MGVYIEGLNEMFAFKVIALTSNWIDGKLEMFAHDANTTDLIGKAIVVQEPHGRLIDADSLKETLDYYIREAGWSDEINEALTWVRDEFIDHEPAIIPKEYRND